MVCAVGVASTVAVSVILVACGRVDDGTSSSADSGSDGTFTKPIGTPDATGWTEPPWDALAVDVAVGPDTGAPPDGGPPPVIACGADAAIPCPLPPSVCVDDHWLRYYYGGTCGDAGVCVYQVGEYACPPSPVQPDCLDGGCRIVIVR